MGLPRLAVEACRAVAGVPLPEIDLSYYLDPSEAHRAARVDSCGLGNPERAQAIEREFDHIRAMAGAHREIYPHLHNVDHHLCHAASAFYPSGFERALILVLDGQGESASTTLFVGEGTRLRPLVRLPVVASLGYLYSNVTGYLGFEPIEDEYKIMGLAAYDAGDEYRGFFDRLIQRDGKGGFVIPSLVDRPMTRLHAWTKALGPPRNPEGPIEPRHIAIAASLQRAVERVVLELVQHHEGVEQTRHLCIAGGVGLNCTMNGVIDRTGQFDRMFVQPAAGDAGAALGAALHSFHAAHPAAPRVPLPHVYFGPSFTEAEVERALRAFGDRLHFSRPADFIGEVARALASDRVIGWFQGRMEFGPRALGNRSILADPRRAEMKDRVNQAVKKREEFRPFAPSVTRESAEAFFELRHPDQYQHMTIAVRARPERKAEIPAVVHCNGTARVHVVRREVNPRYWELLTRFGQETGIPVLLNTSFNVRGEAMVCTPEDAIRCFLETGIDHLAMEGYFVSK
jgi:carbamoyltransferase